MFKLNDKKIWVAGHRGMVGAAVTKKLRNYDCKLITVGREELNLVNQKAVHEWMAHERGPCIRLIEAVRAHSEDCSTCNALHVSSPHGFGLSIPN